MVYLVYRNYIEKLKETQAMIEESKPKPRDRAQKRLDMRITCKSAILRHKLSTDQPFSVQHCQVTVKVEKRLETDKGDGWEVIALRSQINL